MTSHLYEQVGDNERLMQEEDKTTLQRLAALTEEDWEELAKRFPPPQSWYDEDHAGLFGDE